MSSCKQSSSICNKSLVDNRNSRSRFSINSTRNFSALYIKLLLPKNRDITISNDFSGNVFFYNEMSFVFGFIYMFIPFSPLANTNLHKNLAQCC